jgi:pyocin large subunit-like protein
MRFAFVFLGLLALSACDAGPSAVMADGEGKAASDKVKPLAAPVWAQAAKSSASEDIEEASMPLVSEAAPDTGHAAISDTRYGDWPLWSVSRKYSASDNARYQFEHHGSEFGVASYEAFLAKVHGFIHSPPAGTETVKRGNGDTLFYNADSNTFAVMTKDGAPRILMKPDAGAAYWQEQKQTEAARKAKHAGGDEG